ncbi:hypothetical protein CCR79_10400 [Halorhodospira halophila]|nr:hypothetical protein [Halorhodospira halophila]
MSGDGAAPDPLHWGRDATGGAGMTDDGTIRQGGGDPALARELSSATVVIFRSGLTDTRSVVRALHRSGVDYREVEMPMGSAQMRDRFHQLQEMTGWRSLPQIFVHGAFVGGPDELLEHPVVGGDTAASARAERPGRALGYAGLIPFVVGLLVAAAAPAGVHEQAVAATLAYGAAILAFLGGVHWGVALLRDQRPWPVMTVGVLPALVGWLGAGLGVVAAPAAGALLLAAGFAAWYGYERLADPGTGFPPWYRQLRGRLTAVVCAVLVLLALIA